MSESDLSSTERIGIVVWKLAAGASPTTAEVAAMTGVTRAGAWCIMDRLSRVLPLYQQRVGNRLEWHILSQTTIGNGGSRPQ